MSIPLQCHITPSYYDNLHLRIIPQDIRFKGGEATGE